uniref:hypothetical protein n=1 Tax=Herbidospora sakaeratensis TaxID=564415 RepID=UPI000A73361A|nr:hypothetical protein [Herbidospora sakaeratensis]
MWEFLSAAQYQEPRTLPYGDAGSTHGARDQFAALLPIRERVSGVEHPHTPAARANLAYGVRRGREEEGTGNPSGEAHGPLTAIRSLGGESP